MKQQSYNLFTESLSDEQFDKYFDEIIERTRAVLKVKAKEYVRENDRLHNFNVASKKQDVQRERAIGFFRLKHEVSIDDMLNDIDKGLLPERAVVSEKFGDRLNYDILEEISILHRVDSADKKHDNFLDD